MKISGEITQIEPSSRVAMGAWMNVRELGSGGIGVWTMRHKVPVALLFTKESKEIMLATWNSEAWAKEWVAEHGHHYRIEWLSGEPT